MRVVVDTNLVISAMISPNGTSEQVLREWEGSSFELLMSRALFDEIEEVVARPKHSRVFRERAKWVESLFGRFRLSATLLRDIPDIPQFAADPKDTMILALAIAGDADVIVSGDKHLRELIAYQNIPILSPRQFLELLDSTQGE